MDVRHEWKHAVSYADRLTLETRLSAVMQCDPHAVSGQYNIRSLYFDNLFDKALLEKLNGVNHREKFRIRYYNGDTSFIMLEKKSKINDLCSKQQVILTYEEAQAIANADMQQLTDCRKALVQELYCKMQTQGLRPKTIVDYTRKPFIYPPGNVRVTIDYDIRTGITETNFLDPACITVPAGDAPIILEVKWDAFLPSVIRDLIQLPGIHSAAFSKYAACRIYG